MAQKLRAPPTQPPPSSSSSSEGLAGYSSSSDEEQANNSSKPDPKRASIQNQESESEEESSDEDEEEDENPQPVKPTPPKPEPKSEKKMVAPSKPIPKASSGKSPFVRIWSVDDEIAILQALLDYQSKNGRIELNAARVKDLHDSIRKSLSINVDTAKLVEKLRRTRKKYIGASKKGANLKFTKTHDKTIYELSEKIWGKKEEDGFEVNASNGNSGRHEGKSLKREFPFISDALGGNRLALEMLEMVDVKKVVALEENFKKLKSAEINLIREVYMLLQ